MAVLAGQFPQKYSNVKGLSFHVAMVAAFVFLLVITVLPIIFFGYYQEKIVISDLGNDLIEHISKAAIEKTSNYFMPASIVVQMSSKLAELGAISCNNCMQTEMYTLGVLESYPQISMFYIGDEQGNYVHAWRRAGGNMESWIIRASDSPATSSLICRNAALEVTEIKESNSVDYDPRTRPWYRGAKETGANFWTDVYISFSSRKPAITCSQPVFGPDGKFRGVWAMDIELDEISSFLKTQKIGKSGIELIINEKGDIVAYPELSSIIREENGVLRPVRLEELGVEPVSAAYREYASTGKSRSTVESGGKTYFASFTEFPERFPRAVENRSGGSRRRFYGRGQAGDDNNASNLLGYAGARRFAGLCHLSGHHQPRSAHGRSHQEN